MSFSGYVLNGEKENFYYMSLSRLHPQRIQATKRLSESTANPTQQASPGAVGRQAEDVTGALESEMEARLTEADSEVGHHLSLLFIYK